MKQSFVLIAWIKVVLLFGQPNIQPIGYWREHLPYYNTQQIVKGNQLYIATATHLFAIENQSVNRYTKVNGLTDMDVSAIAWDATTEQLVIAYKNSNVDIITKNGSIKNIGDIKRSNIVANKTVYQIYCEAGKAYLATGLGIIVLNLSKYEVADTWFIGNGGNYSRVNEIAANFTHFFAATEEGLKVAPKNGTLSNFSQWQKISSNQGLSDGNIDGIQFLNQQPIVLKNDSVFIGNQQNQFSFIYHSSSWTIINLSVSDNKILICERNNNSGNSRVLNIANNGTVLQTIAQPGVISFPKNAYAENNSIWVADFFGGLAKFSGSTIERFIPNGPQGTADGKIIATSKKVYIAAGSVNDAWNYQYNRNGIYVLDETAWSSFGNFNTPALQNVLDFITLSIQPSDQSLWAGSYGGGLVHFKANTTTIYNSANSTLQSAIGDPGSVRVSGLAFDNEENLWIANYGTTQQLHVRKKDGNWKAFSSPFILSDNAVSDLVMDDVQQIWMVSPRGNGVIVFNYGNTIDNTSDDKWKWYRTGLNNGNLPSNQVYAIAKDKNGMIWIGTDKGVAVIQCPESVFSNGCNAIQPIVQQDRFAGYLLADETVQDIAVDGANRKWVATKNGVWLINADGDKLLLHLTAENSPLLSNDVKKIGIHPITGEVFFGTFKGICSFRSTATEATATQAANQVIVFPNPVPQQYNGTIAIRGVPENSIVKIAEPNGRLVFQTRALGSQAVWDGRDYKGNKVASGVYLVLAQSSHSNEKTVTKIIVLGGR